MTITKEQLDELVARHGFTGKLVRAYCALRGWRYDKNGAPPEWYAAWRSGLGRELEGTP